MKIIYDPYADALNITFKEGRVKKTIEVAPEMFLDLDAKSKPLYLEIIGVKDKIGRVSAAEISMSNLIFNGKEKELSFAS